MMQRIEYYNKKIFIQETDSIIIAGTWGIDAAEKSMGKKGISDIKNFFQPFPRQKFLTTRCLGVTVSNSIEQNKQKTTSDMTHVPHEAFFFPFSTIMFLKTL